MKEESGTCEVAMREDGSVNSGTITKAAWIRIRSRSGTRFRLTAAAQGAKDGLEDAHASRGTPRSVKMPMARASLQVLPITTYK